MSETLIEAIDRLVAAIDRLSAIPAPYNQTTTRNPTFEVHRWAYDPVNDAWKLVKEEIERE